MRGSSRFVHAVDETQLSAAAPGARIKARMRVRAMRNWTNDRVSEALFRSVEMVWSMVGMKMKSRWWENERIASLLRVSHSQNCVLVCWLH